MSDNWVNLRNLSPMEVELGRLRGHSVILNRVAWDIHQAMGLIPDGATSWVGDIEENLAEACRLIRAARETGL